MTTFSLHPVKQITTAEGGVVTTDDERLAAKLKLFRNHGITTDARQRESTGSWFYEMTTLGFNYRLSDLQCALGSAQLQRLDKWVARRREIAARYASAFAGERALELPTVRSDRESAWHLYVLRLHLDQLKIGRSEFVDQLKQRGVGTSVHFIPLHMHPYYRDTYHYCHESFPVALREYYRSFSLPIYPGMSPDQVAYVIEQVSEVVKQGRR